MLINTLVGKFCGPTFIPKQLIILGVGYKWSRCLNCFASASKLIRIPSQLRFLQL